MSGNNVLGARDLELARNTETEIEEHKKRNEGKIITRFPPEPNGFNDYSERFDIINSFTLGIFISDTANLCT